MKRETRARVEAWLSERQRQRLAELADDSGLSSADLIRLAINQLLARRSVSLKTERIEDDSN
jgi:Ribbon-helix-helix protein, copG family